VRELAVRSWGAPGAPCVVFLHGVTSHGNHARLLAENWLAERYHVLAPDLLGHGASPYEPPWDLDAHAESVLASVGPEPAAWIGHSFGARIAIEIAAREPAAVERIVLLDPAVLLPPQVALFAAENARTERAYESFEEGIDERFDESSLVSTPRELIETELAKHLVRSDDGRWRYRYSQAAVVAAYGEMASEPPSFERVRVPTLLVLGDRSYVPYDHLLDAHRAALGDLLEVVSVPGGHTVLWDSLSETAAAVTAFLGAADPAR
jgi:lipase